MSHFTFFPLDLTLLLSLVKEGRKGGREKEGKEGGRKEEGQTEGRKEGREERRNSQNRWENDTKLNMILIAQ